MAVFRNFILVGMGGALGAMLRYGVTLMFTFLQWSSNVGIFIVNAVGSICMGLLVGCFQQSPWLLMATIGICGGFTTFSTFSMQSVTLMQQGRIGAAVLYVIGTVVVCIAFAAIGYSLAPRLR